MTTERGKKLGIRDITKLKNAKMQKKAGSIQYLQHHPHSCHVIVAQLITNEFIKPMGVSTYRTSQELPEHFRKALPNIEDLKKLL